VDDRELMERALAQASEGLRRGAMPIGAVLAHGGVLGEAYWREDGHRGVLGHPESRLLQGADPSIDWAGRREATLYTTLEPCLMCMGTAMSFFLGRIVYAMSSPADGAANVADAWRPALGHPAGGGAYSVPVVEGGLCAAEARALVAAWLESGATGPEADFARQLLR
jgi:tRNA(adenine34) deaminase